MQRFDDHLLFHPKIDLLSTYKLLLKSLLKVLTSKLCVIAETDIWFINRVDN